MGMIVKKIDGYGWSLEVVTCSRSRKLRILPVTVIGKLLTKTTQRATLQQAIRRPNDPAAATDNFHLYNDMGLPPSRDRRDQEGEGAGFRSRIMCAKTGSSSPSLPRY
jgi:hypothetical protein